MSDGSDVGHVVPDAWGRFASGASRLSRAPRFGMTYPASPDEQRRGDELVFMAGALVDEPPRALPPGFSVKRTRPTEFAVFAHGGPGEAFPDTVTYALVDWLPGSPYEFDADGVQLRSFGTGREGCDEFWLPLVPRGEPAPWRTRPRVR